LLGPSSQLPAVDCFDLLFACSTEELVVFLVYIFGVGLDDLLGVVIKRLLVRPKLLSLEFQASLN
jgi:hypothetical protein